MSRSTFQLAAAAAVATVLFGGLPVAAAFEPPTEQDAAMLQAGGNYDEASEAWATILEADPDNGTAWFNLGYSLHMAGHLEKALGAHKKAATFDEYEGIAYYNVACAYSLLGHSDEAFLALAKSREAGFDVSSYAEDDSDLDGLRDDPRYEAMMTGRDIAPQRVRVLEAEPREPQRRQSAGPEKLQQLFQFVGERMQPIIQELAPQAEKRFAEVAELAMYHTQELVGQLHAMVEQDEDLVHALQEIHMILAEDPNIGPLMQRAQAWMEQQMGGGRAPQGSADRPAMITVEPQAALPSLSDAQRLQQQGKHEAAAEAFGVIVEQQPDNAAARFGYAYNLHMAGALDAAIEAHKAAAEFPQLEGIAMYNLGCAYALKGKPEMAIEALKKSMDAGFDVENRVDDDSDFDPIRKHAAFVRFRRSLDG